MKQKYAKLEIQILHAATIIITRFSKQNVRESQTLHKLRFALRVYPQYQFPDDCFMLHSCLRSTVLIPPPNNDDMYHDFLSNFARFPPVPSRFVSPNDILVAPITVDCVFLHGTARAAGCTSLFRISPDTSAGSLLEKLVRRRFIEIERA